MKYTTVSTLQWADAAHTAIIADVAFDEHGTLPFSASASDVEAHGREIFSRAVAGDFGPIAAFPAPSLSVVKAAKLTYLQQARDNASSANVVVQGKTFSADPKIADLFSKLADRSRRGKPSTLTAIFDVNGAPVTPTSILLGQIEDAIASQIETAWNRYGTLLAQVAAATSTAQVDAVVW